MKLQALNEKSKNNKQKDLMSRFSPESVRRPKILVRKEPKITWYEPHFIFFKKHESHKLIIVWESEKGHIVLRSHGSYRLVIEWCHENQSKIIKFFLYGCMVPYYSSFVICIFGQPGLKWAVHSFISQHIVNIYCFTASLTKLNGPVFFDHFLCQLTDFSNHSCIKMNTFMSHSSRGEVPEIISVVSEIWIYSAPFSVDSENTKKTSFDQGFYRAN